MTALSCRCCDECAHDVSDLTMRGMMPDTLDGREVRVLVAREVSSCVSCGAKVEKEELGEH